VKSRQQDVGVRRAAADPEAARRESAARWAALVAEKDALPEAEPTALALEGPTGREQQEPETLQQEQQWVLPEEHLERMA
jgi:hypothetical protein